MNNVTIRPATRADDDAIWAMLEPVIRGGDTYALPRDMALRFQRIKVLQFHLLLDGTVSS